MAGGNLHPRVIVRKGGVEEDSGSNASAQIGMWEGGKIWAISEAQQYLWLMLPEIHQERAPSRVLIMLPEGKAVRTGHEIWALSGALQYLWLTEGRLGPAA